MKFKKPIEVSAPAYTALLMEWIEQLLDNERVFPVTAGEPFPADFVDTIRKIFRRLFRVYAHIYHSHFNKVCELGEEAHLNTLFKHFIFFSHYFNLISKWLLIPLLIFHLLSKQASKQSMHYFSRTNLLPFLLLSSARNRTTTGSGG